MTELNIINKEIFRNINSSNLNKNVDLVYLRCFFLFHVRNNFIETQKVPGKRSFRMRISNCQHFQYSFDINLFNKIINLIDDFSQTFITFASIKTG